MKKYRIRPKRFLPAILLLAACAAVLGFSLSAFAARAGSAGSDMAPIPYIPYSSLSQSAPPPTTQTPSSPSAASTQPTAELPWNLTLVNKENAVPGGWSCTVTLIRYAQSVDTRILPELQAMMDACREAGFKPMVCSGYRTQEKQQALFTERVSELKQQGLTGEEAESRAKETVSPPGFSEHQLGLAVDIVSETNQLVTLAAQREEPVLAWLRQHCAEYGFILRYPADKEEETGYSEEPWHFRYVGEAEAKAIENGGYSLESYVASLGA